MSQHDRNNRPSASGFERLVLCPGSWQMEQGEKSVESDDAASGTRIHAALAGENVELNAEEQETFEACVRIRDFILGEQGYSDEEYHKVTEHRLWFDDMASAQVDFVAIVDEFALVLDYKTGRGEVEQAEGNFQLMLQAVCASWEFGSEFVTVGIIQPWASPQYSLANYDENALDDAEEIILAAITKANDPNAPRIPGEKQCKYCKAKYKCPEAQKPVAELAVMPLRSGPVISPVQMGELLDKCKLASAIIHDLRERAKAMLAEGVEIPGWKLSPGAERRTITDIATIHQRLVDIGLPSEEFVKHVDISFKDLKALIKNTTGLKGKALNEKEEQLLQGCVEKKQTEKSLERIS